MLKISVQQHMQCRHLTGIFSSARLITEKSVLWSITYAYVVLVRTGRPDFARLPLCYLETVGVKPIHEARMPGISARCMARQRVREARESTSMHIKCTNTCMHTIDEQRQAHSLL